MAFSHTTEYLPGDAGGCCFFCRSAQREDAGVPEALFRTDANHDGDVYLCVDGHPVEGLDRGQGNVVICETCAVELAGLLGFISPAALEEYTAVIADADARVAAAEERATVAEALVGAIRAYDTRVVVGDLGDGSVAVNTASNGADNGEPDAADAADAEAAPVEPEKAKRPRARKDDNA